MLSGRKYLSAPYIDRSFDKRAIAVNSLHLVTHMRVNELGHN